VGLKYAKNALMAGALLRTPLGSSRDTALQSQPFLAP